jgi:transcriptional regulator with XRE-family HTH domain
MDKANQRVVKVNGVLLSSDLGVSNMTKDVLLDKIAESGGEFVPSKSTLQRAERGEVIQYEMLKAIAGGLGFHVDRYVVEHSELEASTTCDIAGMWEGFYIEPDADARPSIVGSEMQIVQHGANLFIYHTDAEESGEERTNEVLEAYIIRDLVMIKSKVGGWTPPFGVSNSQLKLKNGDDVLAGYSVWYDLDTAEIECSKAVYVRASSQYRDAYLEKAKNVMLKEKERLIKRQ